MNRSSCVNESILNLPMEDDNVLEFLERARHMPSFLIEDQTSLSLLSLGKVESTSDPFSEMDLDDVCSTIREHTPALPPHNVDNDDGLEAHQVPTDGRRKVHFSTAEFRHYALVVGSHDHVEAAMELDWKFNPEISVRNLQSEQRDQYKPRKLSYRERKERLEEVSDIRILDDSQQQSSSLKGLPRHSDALVDMADFSLLLGS